MKAPKGCILLAAALTVSSNVRVWAGPQSLLDPYASIQAPGAKTKATKTKATKASKANKSEEKPEEKAEAKKSSTRSALSSLESEEEKPVEKVDKPVKSEKKTHVAKEKGGDKPLTPSSSDGGVVSGINDIKNSYVKTFKAAGSGIMSGTKAAGAKVAGGGKKVKDGFMNGAKAIGHGFKMPGGKSKNAGGAPDNKKVAAAPRKASHSEKSQELDTSGGGDASASQAVGEKVLDDASFPGKPLEPLAAKPLVKGSSKSAGGPSMIGRTFGKLNVFG
ncbi:MAG: hypothetical protein C5B53_09605, partial [Candidatus Melainabacteria bacterium]